MYQRELVFLYFLMGLETAPQYTVLAVSIRDFKDTCEDVLKEENVEIWTNIATLNSLFYHVYKTGCLVCALPECDYYSPNCAKWSKLNIIPVYNNILEFGLSGKYIPRRAAIRFSFNKKCYFYIYAYPNRKRMSAVVEVEECYLNTGQCSPKKYRREYLVKFDNQHCLNFGLAIYEKDKFHVTSSAFCNTFASAKFDELIYIDIQEERCYFNKATDKPVVEYRFEQGDERHFDGVPLILPCSPGGFAVDPESGRFVTGETCWKMFSESKRDEVGINFLIRKVYNNTNEDLMFPKGQYRNTKRVRPIYMNKAGRAADRDKMAPKIVPNKEKGNRKREICDYEELEVATQRPSLITSGSTTTAPTDNGVQPPQQGTFPPCSQILSSMRQNLSSESDEDEQEINYYIHKTSGCFICAEAECNFPNCSETTATASIPVYNSLFEFGLSGQHFPTEGTVLVTLNPDCYLKTDIQVDISNASPNITYNITIRINECVNGTNSENQCKELDVQGNADQILFNNWYCVYVALALHQTHRVYYAFSFRCDKFGGSQLNESIFVDLNQDVCRSRSSNLKADFEFRQDHSRSHDGVPIILPCSPGGYAVDAIKGRFTVNQTCDDMFWETMVNATKVTGIHFILKEIFKNNENLLFKTRTDVDAKYPTPIYIKNNGQAYSPSEMQSSLVRNSEIEEKFREKCLFKRQGNVSSSEISTSSSFTRILSTTIEEEEETLKVITTTEVTTTSTTTTEATTEESRSEVTSGCTVSRCRYKVMYLIIIIIINIMKFKI